MKHLNNDDVLQTNIFQALHKNKIIQDKLNERQRLYCTELIKDMQNYNLNEQLNRELLYAWKKESYIRQLRKHLQEYERKRFGVRDAYYDYQVRNLEHIMTDSKSLIIPLSEEKSRLNINTKVRQFLQDNPLRLATSMCIDQTKQKEEERWKQIPIQSTVGIRRQEPNILPSIQCSSTTNEIRQNKNLTKRFDLPTTASRTSRFAPVRSRLFESIEPILVTSEILQKQTRVDLVAMRSIRRPQRNPIDLNLTFEARKHFYQTKKRVYNRWI